MHVITNLNHIPEQNFNFKKIPIYNISCSDNFLCYLEAPYFAKNDKKYIFWLQNNASRSSLEHKVS